jgi:hypothetical protein
VQEGEQQLARPHPVVLPGYRHLDFDDEVTGFPDVIGRREDRRARRGELLVRQRRARAGRRLDEDLVPGAGELVHARWRDRHPELVVRHFRRNTDLHELPAVRCPENHLRTQRTQEQPAG